MIDRIIGVVTLKPEAYEEIEHDESAMTQAAIIVGVVAVIGGLINGAISAAFLDGSFIGGFLSQLLGAFIGWFVWSFATYFVGTTFFGGTADVGEMLRVLGFAQAPGILGIIPVCGGFVGSIWTLACTFIAIRQGLDLDNRNAIFTAIISWVAVLIVSFVIGSILAALGLAAGAGLEALGG